jgi:hypothetical protein
VRNQLYAYVAACATSIVDNDRLPEALSSLRGYQPSQDISAASRREGHDKSNRFFRITLRPGACDDQAPQHASARNADNRVLQFQQLATYPRQMSQHKLDMLLLAHWNQETSLGAQFFHQCSDA